MGIKADITNLMEKRGYVMHSGIKFHDKYIGYNYIKNTGLKFIDRNNYEQDILIHAQTNLQTNTVCLSFVDLPMLMKIESGDFSITHPDFKRFEDYIIRYAQVCTKQRL